jgi:hypothetical protein
MPGITSQQRIILFCSPFISFNNQVLVLIRVARALSRFARVALIFMGFHGIGYGTLKLLCDLPSLQP